MLSGWRIQKHKHNATSFTGEGSRRCGGRWNSVGVAMVYLSRHQSLAVLEIFLQPRPLSSLDPYIVIGAEWDEKLVETLPADQLPENWRALPAGPATAAIGDLWIKQDRSAVLAVPSVIVPAETNFLLNPRHPDFRRIKIGRPERFVFDPRLLAG